MDKKNTTSALTYRGNIIIAAHRKSLLEGERETIIESYFPTHGDRDIIETARIAHEFSLHHRAVNHVGSLDGRHHLSLLNLILITEGANPPVYLH